MPGKPPLPVSITYERMSFMTYSSTNAIGILIGAAPAFFIQAGFSMCEAGFTRAKSTENILMKT